MTLKDAEGTYYLDSGYSNQYFQVLYEEDGEWELAKNQLPHFDGQPTVHADISGVIWLYFPTDLSAEETTTLIVWPDEEVDTVHTINDLDAFETTALWYDQEEVTRVIRAGFYQESFFVELQR